MGNQRVMFLCTGNSCRSQMAEGLLRHVAGDRFEVVSAGTQPVGVNPGAVEVMREASPIYPSAASVLHWSLDDPAAAQGPADIRRAVFRRVRDDIAERIRHFIDDQQ